jgi:hypothetical protein
MKYTIEINDNLDPDIHNPEVFDDSEQENVVEFIDSTCRVSINNLRTQAEQAVSFIEHNPHLFACSWKDLFSHAPKGPFTWAMEEAGDWVPSEDCDLDEGWTKTAYGMNISRRDDGTEVVEFWEVDADGNTETRCEFERKPKARLDKFDLRDFQFEAATSNHCYYTLLKQALYSIYVAETGKDPLQDTLGNADPREVHIRNLAHEVPNLRASVYRTATEALLKQK